jgi:tetrapyrrole methylase family protein/MazG family protein
MSLSSSKLGSQISSELFKELLGIIAKLRGPDGCPWDKEQSQKSLAQYAIEEAFELAEAIETGDQRAVVDELGDFLFQVILQAQVASDEGLFTIDDVLKNLNEKMIRRHPHVFGDLKTNSMAEIWKNWESTKLQENVASGASKPKPVFSYPRSMPALQAAQKIGLKTRNWKFDWPSAASVFEKVDEEIAELREEMARPELDPHALEHEMGDVLFVCAQLARHLNLEPEQSLREANRRFEKRFSEMLRICGLNTSQFTDLTEEEKEKLWLQAKLAEKADFQ